MDKVLKDFCNNILNNRKLMLLTAPTGSRKTTAVRKYIVENYEEYCKEGRKIFFITQLKKNLPYKELEDDFRDSGIPEKFLNDVMFIENNADTLINNYLSKNIYIPQKEFSNLKIFAFLSNYKNKLHELTQNYTEEKLEHINFIKSRIIEEFEPELRRKILVWLANRCRTEVERRNIITKGELNWVSQLYPTVFTNKKKVLMMSIDKFLSKHTTFIENAYFFIDHKSIKDAIVFIDEFDTAKNVIQKNQINYGLQGKINIIRLFTKIYQSLETMNFTQEILQDGLEFQRNEREYTPLEIKDKMKEFSKEIFDEFHLHNFYKLKEDKVDIRIENEFSENNFLFYDVNFHSILSKSNSTIHIDFKENINHFILSNEKDEEYLIFNLINKINSFIDFFINGIHWWSTRYQKIKNKNRQESDFSIDYARRSILTEFGLDTIEKEWIINKININTKLKNFEYLETESYYDEGLSFFHFIDSDNHATITNINYYNFDVTPEKYLLNLLSESRVVGISATAEIKTVLGNFNINYLEKALKENYYKISELDLKRMTDKFKLQKIESNEYEICVNHITSHFDDFDFQKYIFSKIENANKMDDYVIERYIRIYKVIEQFILKECKAFICFMNLHMTSDGRLNRRLIHMIWDELLLKHGKSNTNYSLYSLKTNNYDTEKNKIHDDLSQNKRVLLFSTYQTVGAGQNIQYTVPDMDNDAFMNEEDIIEEFIKSKDFDGIYLDHPTNIIVNMNESVTEENFIKYLMQMEDLKENTELEDDKALEKIKFAFRKYYDNKKIVNSSLANLPSYKMFILKTFIQAIGRICRTNNKNEKVQILMHDKICLAIANFEEVIHDFQNDEINLAIKYCVDNFKIEPKNKFIDEDIVKNEANNKYLDDLLKKIRKEEEARQEWQEIREFVLKYPLTKSSEELMKTKFQLKFHKYFNNITNLYYYKYQNSRQNKLEKINLYDKDDFSKEFSFKKAKIAEITKIPGLSDYFKEKNYKLFFDNCNYLLMPEIFDRIYLGALGETVGKFILQKNNIECRDIMKIEYFEKFDYQINQDIFIDFKFYEESSRIGRKDLNRIRNKKKACNAKIVFIINVLGTGKYTINSIEHEGIYFIPALFNIIDSKIIQENINKIKEIITDYEAENIYVA